MADTYGYPPGGGSQGAQKKGGSGVKTFFIAFAGALLACVLAFGVAGAVGAFRAFFPGPGSPVSLGAGTSTVIDAEDPDITLAEAVAAKALPSVVAIDVYTQQSAGGYYDFFGFGYGSDSDSGGELMQSSLGSGVVLSADGYIITNYHVIEGFDALMVTIEGKQYEAELVGSDASSDVAVIKAVDAAGLTPIEIGDSDDLTIGEWVMTIGSPFGLEQSVATGIVSATSRSQVMSQSSGYGYGSSGEMTFYPNMIQTDAAINPGNSGGALVNANGQLIGVNTLITSYSGNYSGVGFAIPVNYALDLAQQIIKGETPSHAQLGVSLSSVNAETAQRYGFTVSEGAYVASVMPGSGADAAGIREGDIITAFDGQRVSSASDVILDVRANDPGDVVNLTVNRDGETMEVQVTLGTDANSAVAQQDDGRQQRDSSQGLSERDLSLLDELLREFGMGLGDLGNSYGQDAA